MRIRKMTPNDWKQVSQIYLEGIATGLATFEQQIPSYESWDNAHVEACRLVAEQDGQIHGWAALSPVSSRCVYGGVGEVSVYVGSNSRGTGVGRLLLEKLIAESEAAGFWTIQSGVFPENEPSIQLHRKVGFRYIGKRERIGKSNGVWKDNLLFEKRSKTIGKD
ncbi:GNAT family N-acetyltransferase [Flagellimonas myxillae]|uniref:GNAT family N-acetyltransferase n=1 Tax=Flagellimonas myxillae TaxID=2942214 RepID=UPI00201ED775|nr:GNAT family N-acetyltransferase [Muricauda myxillae]MCL6267029.1 N-acetyltransferase family protein [Muricauda myxillae]